MGRKLRTAVVGLGRIGWQFHIPEILKHKGFELVAVADPLPERLMEGRERYRISGYLDYSELIEKEKLDLIVIASPTPYHAEQALQAMGKGIDVIMEKPMAPTLSEVDQLIGSMQKLGRKLMVYQPHRTTPETQAIRYMIHQDILGPVYMIKHAACSYTRRNDWQSLKKYGGGMLNNYGAHYIDQLLYITGATAGRISCHLRKIASLGDADDVVKLLIETDNGIILDLDINMACAQELTGWVILGQRGTAITKKAQDGNQYFDMKYYIDKELSDLSLKDGMAAPGRFYGNHEKIPWKNEQLDISHFKSIPFYEKCYEYFAEDKKPFIPVAETREVMRIINECHKTGWGGNK